MKKFISFFEMGYDDDFYDSNGYRHRDNRFIGVYGNPDDEWTLAYCDSTTGKIFAQDIYEYVDGKKTLVDIKLLEIAEKNNLYRVKTTKRCNECLECHHFSNGCNGNNEPCEAFEYAKW